MKTKFPDYTSEEIILILNLYLKNRDVNILQQKDKRVIQISEILKEMYHKNFPKRKIPESFRSTGAIVYKMNKFRAFDGNEKSSASKLDKELWNKYKSKPKSIIDEKANEIIERYFPGKKQFQLINSSITDVGKEYEVSTGVNK